jgi:hypothetical protein
VPDTPELGARPLDGTAWVDAGSHHDTLTLTHERPHEWHERVHMASSRDIGDENGHGRQLMGS